MIKPFRFHKDGRAGGNALFLILIAVALFAALSYAITQSGRGGGSISKEQAALNAAQIVQITGDIHQGIQRMILSGIPASSIEAGTPADTAYPGLGTSSGYADLCTSGEACLFSPEGGGVPFPKMPAGAFTDQWGGFAGPHGLNGIIIEGFSGTADSTRPWPGVGTDAGDEDIWIVPLKEEVCKEINKGLGISGPIKSYGDPDQSQQAECVYDGVAYIYYDILVAH